MPHLARPSFTSCVSLSPRSAGRTIALLVVLSLFAGPASAQGETRSADNPSPAWAWWLSAAIGSSTLGGSGGALALSYQRTHIVGSIRVSLSDDGQPCTECFGGDAGDIGLIVSYATLAGRRLHFSAGAGLGYADYEPGTASPSGIGVPAELQASWWPTSVVGLGIYGWANSFGPQGGIGIALQIGRLR